MKVKKIKDSFLKLLTSAIVEVEHQKTTRWQ